MTEHHGCVCVPLSTLCVTVLCCVATVCANVYNVVCPAHHTSVSTLSMEASVCAHVVLCVKIMQFCVWLVYGAGGCEPCTSLSREKCVVRGGSPHSSLCAP